MFNLLMASINMICAIICALIWFDTYIKRKKERKKIIDELKRTYDIKFISD